MPTEFHFFPKRRNGAGGLEARLDAAEQVASKLAKLVAARERMRKVNTLVRTRNAAGLMRLGYAARNVAHLLQQDGDARYYFPTDQHLRANYKQILTLRRVARELKRELESMDRDDVTIDRDGYLYREDGAAQIISFRFTAKPDKALRALLRRAGFELRPARNRYERALDGAGIAVARQLREHLDERID